MSISRRNRSLIRLFGVALCLPLMACGASDVNYISRAGLQSDPLYLLNKSEMEAPTNYGAIKFQKLDDAKDEGSLLSYRRKRVYTKPKPCLSLKKIRNTIFPSEWIIKLKPQLSVFVSSSRSVDLF